MPMRANRIQFSIRIDVELKRKLEKLAGVRGITLNDLIEDELKDLADRIKPETWKMIDATIEQVRQETAEAAEGEAEQIETYRRLKDRKRPK